MNIIYQLGEFLKRVFKPRKRKLDSEVSRYIWDGNDIAEVTSPGYIIGVDKTSDLLKDLKDEKEKLEELKKNLEAKIEDATKHLDELEKKARIFLVQPRRL